MARLSLSIATGLAVVAAAPLTAHLLTQHTNSTPQVAAVNSARAGIASPKAAKAAAASGSPVHGGATDTICTFLTEYTNLQSPPNPERICPSANIGGLRVIIAIVPDPVHTRLALRFDRAVDDIQDSVQQLGWSFDSSWLPWDNATHGESVRYQKRKEDLKAEENDEDNPGVLLFRGRDNENPIDPLVVLIVGDTPTAGVNPNQFRNAMAFWRQLNSAVHKPAGADPPTLSILGPTFSGSAQSLRNLLSEEVRSPQTQPNSGCSQTPPIKEIRIASGTLTKSDELFKLFAIWDRCGNLQNVQPVSFAMDQQYESSLLFNFLKIHAGSSPVFFLSENESSFGYGEGGQVGLTSLQNLLALVKGTECGKTDLQCSSLKDGVSAKMESEALRSGAYINPAYAATIHFPREISNLRNAYEKDSIVGFGSSSDNPRTQLQFDTADDTHDDDTVTTFSGQRQVLAMETEMAQIAETLNDPNLRNPIAMLSATDVLDEIFVARYLQRHAPKTTVIIGDADLLFLRRGEDAGLDGTYIAAPWPLIKENEVWSSPAATQGDLLHIYQSQGDEGLQAAATYLLSRQAARKSASDPASTDTPIGISQYRSPIGIPFTSGASRPPLWLSVIGRGRFLPISLVDVDLVQPSLPRLSPISLPQLTTSAVTSAQSTNGIHAKLNLSTKLVVAFVALALFWHGLACIFGRIDRRFAWVYALADAEYHARRLWIQASLSFAAIPALSLVLVPSVTGFTVNVGNFRWVIWILWFIAWALTCWPIIQWSTLRPRKSATPPTEMQCMTRTLIVGSIVAILAFVAIKGIWPLIQPRTRESTEQIFFYYRNSLMQPGISPSLTLLLLLAALAIWLHSYLGRFAFFGHRIPVLPDDHDDVHCPSSKAIEPITDLFTNYSGASLIILGSIALLVMALIWISNSWGPVSLENDKFDICVRIIAVALAILILHDVAVAGWGWHLLRRHCLEQLKRSPVRWGFTWIKGFSWHRIWTGSRILSPDIVFDYVARMIEGNNRSISNIRLGRAYRSLVNQYRSTSPKNATWSTGVAISWQRLHEALAASADLKLDELRLIWSKDHGALTGTDAERGYILQEPLSDELKGDDRIQSLDRMAKEEFVALLYLGYIRMVLIQIRNRILTACICYVLLLWALTSYTWMNHHAIVIAMSVMLLLISTSIVYIYSGMHRDDILSRTTETTAGKLDAEFFEKIIPTIGIPLLSLMASQIPELGNFIFSIVEPGLRSQ